MNRATCFSMLQDIGVLLEVGSDAPVGTVTTTFTLSSTATTDTGTTNNNGAIVSIVVDRRADLKISVYASYLPFPLLSSFSLLTLSVFIVPSYDLQMPIKKHA